MALTDSFFKAVNSNDILLVRIMMQDSLLIDPSFKEFEEMKNATIQMNGLYDEHDGDVFINDRNKWDEDYMDEVMVKVLRNFSYERIDHLKEVVRYLRPVKTIEVLKKNEETHSFANKDISKSNTSNIVCGAIAGGVVTTICGMGTIGVIVGITAGAIIGSMFGNRGK